MVGLVLAGRAVPRQASSLQGKGYMVNSNNSFTRHPPTILFGPRSAGICIYSSTGITFLGRARQSLTGP